MLTRLGRYGKGLAELFSLETKMTGVGRVGTCTQPTAQICRLAPCTPVLLLIVQGYAHTTRCSRASARYRLRGIQSPKVPAGIVECPLHTVKCLLYMGDCLLGNHPKAGSSLTL